MSHEIKVNGYKPSKWPSRPEMNVDAHEKPAVQPDWEQNDDTVVVPFASTPTTNVWEIAPTAADEFFNNISSYTVRYSGMDYHFDVLGTTDYANTTFQGVGGALNPEFGAGIFASTDIPFVIYRVPNANGSYDGTSAYVGKSVSEPPEEIKIFHTNIKQIDTKFLPPNRFVVKITSDDSNNLTADKTIAEIVAAYEAGKDVVASYLDSGVEYQLYAISKIEPFAVFDVSVPGHDSQGLSITNTGVNLTDKLNIPKIYPVDAELIGQMNVPVGVDNDGRLFSENPTVNVGGSDMKMKVFNQLAAGKTVRCALTELRGKLFTLLPYSYNSSGTGYRQLYGVAIEGNDDLSLPVRFYRYISETGMDGAKLFIHPFDNEIIAKDGSGKAYRFCGEIISNTTLNEAMSIYQAQRPLLTYNHEPFIAAELTDNSITIVYTGKGEDGQYSVQKTTFGGITWKSETT